ncbi:MAG: magnesium transporter [Clostridiales bacterium]|nr:magnesium transporter [Clostridiales bacterium]
MEENTVLKNEDISDRISELLEEKDYRSIKQILCDMNAQDIAELIDGFDERNTVLLYRLLPKEPAAELFVEMDPEKQEALIKGFSDTELAQVVSELYVDDAVDIIEEMPANVVRRILKSADPDTRRAINEILKYPEDSAGSIMTTEYVRLDGSYTVADALMHIRRTGIDKETIYTCYVTDNVRRLIGYVSAKTLLLADSDDLIRDIMETKVVSVSALEDKETAAGLMSRYDIIAMPVVDSENRLVGIITVDDAIDVLQEEVTEDIEKMAAILPSDKPYLKTGVFSIWAKRIPWLMLLMVSATFTGQIITSFESALSGMGVVILTAFIPMIMDTGGNAGGQASVTVIRGLATGDISLGDVLKIIWKETRVALLCGVSLSVIGFLKILLVDNLIFGNGIPMTVAAAVCITLTLTVFVAKLTGCTLPLLAKLLKLDPAVMASPFITTIVDAISLFIYFRISVAILS